ncbi:MAG: hypothetical protein JNK74_13840 [Candidatus Hydrogenedentes bacterium]|nr:hypothetical protein [Candidatus Hydrogenedentota bacterium]
MSRMFCTLALAVAFTLHSTAQLAPPPDQEFVYLGEQGELIVPLPNTARPLGSALAVVRNDDGVVLSDWESSAHIAGIKNSGEVTLSKTVPHGVTNMTQFPTTVTLANAKVATSVFAPGTVIARELSEGKKDAPANCVGWAVQIAGRSVFMPRQDSQKPSDFLWIVAPGTGEFSLVHSGARHTGILVSVGKDRVITFGEAAVKFVNEDDKPRYWQYIFEEGGIKVPLSVGAAVGISGEESHEQIIYYRDGKIWAFKRGLDR